jgi:hypothetical protein
LPTSAVGRAVPTPSAAALARAAGKPVDDAMKRAVRERFERHDARASRYWELVAIMSGRSPPVGNVEDWRFIAEAVKAHLADPDTP